MYKDDLRRTSYLFSFHNARGFFYINHWAGFTRRSYCYASFS